MATVLVIEDNPLNMKLATLLLHKAGHTVLCAADAETGLTLARANMPDLVLMDVQLPGMDGVAASAMLKQDPATARIPVIAVTALAPATGQERSWVGGCDAYVAKPLRYAELYAAINTLLVTGQEAAAGAAYPGLRHAPDMPPEPPLPGTLSCPHPGGDSDIGKAAVRTVDLGVLEDLVGRDPQVIHEFLNAFRTNAWEIARELKTACLAHDAVLAARQAHKLRSPACNVGALTLGRLCAEMEAAGNAGCMKTLTSLWPLFEAEFDAVNAFMAAWQASPAELRRGK